MIYFQITQNKYLKSFLFLFIYTTLNTSYAQIIPLHNQLSNRNWELMNTRTVEKNKDGDYVPFFPAPLKSLNRKNIELNGYIIPTKSGFTHSQFLLAVLPIFQCQFCGQQDIPEMVQVFMKTPIKFTNKPIIINGILVINDPPIDDKATFMIVNALLKK